MGVVLGYMGSRLMIAGPPCGSSNDEVSRFSSKIGLNSVEGRVVF